MNHWVRDEAFQKLTRMHQHHPLDNAAGAEPQLRLQPVRFEFMHPTATTVCIAGNFNDGHPETKAMQSFGGGYWIKETTLSPGTYEYCLVVDGKYLTDPRAQETVPNKFGGRNSVLKVFGSQAEFHLDRAEYLRSQNFRGPSA